MILNSEGEILLQHRTDFDSWCGLGGRLEIGETVVEGLTREVFEETGLTIHNPKLIGIYSGPRYFGTYPDGNKTASIQTAFYTREYEGSLRANEESHSVAFFPWDGLPSPITGHHQEYLEDFQRHLNGDLALPVVQ